MSLPFLTSAGNRVRKAGGWLFLCSALFFPSRTLAQCGGITGVVKAWDSVTENASLLGISGYRPTGNEQLDGDPEAPWNSGPIWKWKKREFEGENLFEYHGIKSVPDCVGCMWSSRYIISGFYGLNEDNVTWTFGTQILEEASPCGESEPDVTMSDITDLGGNFQTGYTCETGAGFQRVATLVAKTIQGCACVVSAVSPTGPYIVDYYDGTRSATLTEPDTVEAAVARSGGPIKSKHFARAFEYFAATSPESIQPLPFARRTVTVTLEGCGGPYKIVAPYRTGVYGGHTATTEAAFASVPDFRYKNVLGLDNVTFNDDGEFKFELPLERNRITELLTDEIELIPLEPKPLGSSGTCTSSMRFVLNLGALTDGTTAGILRIKENALTDASFTPAALQLASFGDEDAVEAIRDSSGFLRQVKVPEGLFNILTLAADSYKIDT